MVRLGIVVSEFNFEITKLMLDLALEHAEFLGAEVKEIVMVPGVMEVPLATKELLKREEIDAVVTLGAVIKGETMHDEVIMSHAVRKIMDLSLEYEKPVALGISGPGMSRAEAHARVNYAKRAVEAAVKSLKKLRRIRKEEEK